MRSLGRRITTRLRAAASDQRGFGLLEVVVSGAVVVMIAGGAFTVLEAAGRGSVQERNRASAVGVAQDDQARLRSLKISELSNLVQDRQVYADNVGYTVTSKGEFVSDSTGTASCSQDSKADYIKITSSVSWTSMGGRQPVRLQSIVAPPTGSVAADHGALAIEIQDGTGAGVPGIAVSGSGPESFSGTTNENGCVIFGNLPEGDYSLTPAVSSGLVDRDGDPPAGKTVSVVGQATNTIVLQYAEPGAVKVKFTTRVGSQLVASTADSIIVFNTGMTEEVSFGSVGTRVAEITASPLFPFASPDSVYAGACTTNNPNPQNDDNAPGAAAVESVLVPAGGTAQATVELPALNLTVKSGSSSSSPGSPVNNARVAVYDLDCTVGGNAVTRRMNTNSAGQLPDRGLPWSNNYVVCADNGSKLAFKAADFNTMSLSMDLFLGNGYNGVCP